MKAIRTIVENPKYQEWVVMADYGEGGEIATCGIPQLFGDGTTIEALTEYWKTQGRVFNPTGLPIEIVDVELIVSKEKHLIFATPPEVNVQSENERKWIMKMLPSVQWDDKIYIDQYYVMHNGKPHRVRFNYENNIWYRTSSGKQERKLRNIEFIHKEKIGKGKNKEYHTECTYDQAKELIKTATKRTTKVRHIHKSDVKYEVDVFLNSIYPRGEFIMMEVEVEDIDQELFIPERIQEVMLEEVTGNDAYDNYKMAIDSGIAD